jgi:queuine tRNA-ribosyltransferase
MEVIRHFGGLHRFMNWDGPILTDSGGYQIFSLAKIRKITEEGAHFQNHVDGTPAFISPEKAIEIQASLGSDIAMVLDECPPWPCEHEYAARSLKLTARWAQRCKEANVQRSTSNVQRSMRQLLFGIVQGATFPDLRRESAEATVAIGFDGYAIGGVSVGEPEPEMMAAWKTANRFCLTTSRAIAWGWARRRSCSNSSRAGWICSIASSPPVSRANGTAFTATGTLNLKNAEFILDKSPIEEGCACPACREFTRGYVRHLIKAEEILGLRLITLHNLHFYLELMRRARSAIEAGTFDRFRREFVAGYRPANAA